MTPSGTSAQPPTASAAVGSVDAYVETFLAEDPATAAARARATETGAEPVGPAAGATLRFLAALLDARHVVEIGTGTGVSALWLLRGMRPDGVLTSIDTDAERHKMARLAFTEAGLPSGRTRLILGQALAVLPRLTDGAYDLVHVDGPPREYGECLVEAIRLLRPGGIVVFSMAMRGGRVADATSRDADVLALRSLHGAVREDSRLTPVLLPVGDGLLAAAVVPPGHLPAHHPES
jgi:predicted O-methyltransferase YrrM